MKINIDEDMEIINEMMMMFLVFVMLFVIGRIIVKCIQISKIIEFIDN